jgi:putative Holliday junction resolvase
VSAGRVLGVDLGARRVGVAVSDPERRVAVPVTVIDSKSADCLAVLAQLAVEYEAGLVVVGVARSLSGADGTQAARHRAAIDQMAARLAIPIVEQDERLSTVAAHRALGAAGLDSRRRRGVVDAAAAAWILQGFLDRQRGPAQID